MKPLLLAFLISVFVVAGNAQQKYSDLSGYVTVGNRPVSGVTLTIGNYSLTSDGNGYYRFGFLKPGVVTVMVSPPSKQTRPFKVTITAQPTKMNFPITW